MSFLNSLILFGLTAAVLPILIHLFTKSKAKPIVFSTLRFLKEMQQQKIRRLKLRQLFLLLLRTIIVILIILAFARPTCRTRPGASANTNARSSAVIVVDNSYSMGCLQQEKSSFEIARTVANDVIRVMQPGDEIYLLTSTDTTVNRSFHDFDILRNEIDNIYLETRRTDLSGALKKATSLLSESHNVNKEIYVISDFQATGFTRDTLQKKNSDIRSFALPLIAGSVSNLTVEDVRLVSTILQTAKMAELDVTVRNRGNVPLLNKLIQVVLNDKRVAMTAIDLEPGASKTERFRFMIDQVGFMSGYILLEDDELLDDNKKYFTFTVPEKINLGLLGGDTEDGFYIRLTLKPRLKDSNIFNIVPMSLEEARYQPLEEFDVIAICDVPSITRDIVDHLEDFVGNGGGILLTLGQQIDIKNYNESFNRALKLPNFLGVLGSTAYQASLFSLGRTDVTHPIFYGIFEKNEVNLGQPQFRFAIKVKPSKGVNEIMSFSSGDPYLYEARSGQGTVLVFTSGFNLRLNDIAYRTIFAPLVNRCISYLNLRGQSNQRVLLVGDELRFRLPAESLNRKLAIMRPGGQQDRIQPVVTRSGAWVQYSDTDQTGIYRLSADDQVLSQWALNSDVRESDLTPMDFDELKREYNLIRIDKTNKTNALSSVISGYRVGQELWRYFALAVFILLLMEMFIYREKGEVNS